MVVGDGRLGTCAPPPTHLLSSNPQRLTIFRQGIPKEVSVAFPYLSLSARAYSPSPGPYDAIHVGAAAPTLPSALVEQLAQPGMMFIPVGTHTQYIWQVSKDADGKVSQQKVMGVVVSITTAKVLFFPSMSDWVPQYVPLTDPPTF
jgi:Protein-L-isoaspartate(D-aspartate) O-methyltransferase (PCMT)